MGHYMIERIVCGASGATTIGGCNEITLSENIETVLDAGGSEVDPSRITVERFSKMYTISTLDCGVALAAMFANNIPYITATAAAPILLYLQAIADGGMRGGAGTNQLHTINKGIMVPTRLSIDRRCVLSCDIYVAYDGTNAAVARTTGVNLPSGASGAATVWRGHYVKDDTTVISKVLSGTIDFGIRVGRQNPISTIQTVDQGIEAFAPTATFETPAIATLLGLTGFSAAVSGSAGLQFFLAAYDSSTGLVTTSGGIKLAFRAGTPYCPVRIQANPGTNKTITVQAIGKGGTAITNYPLTYTGSQTLTAETYTAQAFMPGPVKDNTTEIELAEFTFSFNIQMVADQPPANLLWPTVVFINFREPEGRVSTSNQDAYTAYADGAAVATGFHFYLRKVTDDGAPIADATASHIKITINAGLIIPQRTGGAHRSTLKPEILVRARKDSGAMLTLSTASAIT